MILFVSIFNRVRTMSRQMVPWKAIVRKSSGPHHVAPNGPMKSTLALWPPWNIQDQAPTQPWRCDRFALAFHASFELVRYRMHLEVRGKSKENIDLGTNNCQNLGVAYQFNSNSDFFCVCKKNIQCRWGPESSDNDENLWTTFEPFFRFFSSRFFILHQKKIKT